MSAARAWKAVLILIALAYAVLGFFAIIESRELANKDVDYDGNKILFPILYCRPSTYSIAGTVVSADTGDVGTYMCM